MARVVAESDYLGRQCRSVTARLGAMAAPHPQSRHSTAGHQDG